MRINNVLKCLSFYLTQWKFTLTNCIKFREKSPALWRKHAHRTVVSHFAQYKRFCLELYICYTYCMYKQFCAENKTFHIIRSSYFVPLAVVSCTATMYKTGFIYLVILVIEVTLWKKVCHFPVHSRNVTNQTLPERENFNYSRQGRVWFLTSRLETRKSLTFFLQCIHLFLLQRD